MPISDAHIWLARFNSPEALARYLEENFDGDDDEAPISQFAEDQDEPFYDHDLVYAEFQQDANVRSLLEIWGFPTNAIESVLSAVSAMDVISPNCSFVADKDEFSNPKSAQGQDYRIWYIGQFNGCSL